MTLWYATPEARAALRRTPEIAVGKDALSGRPRACHAGRYVRRLERLHEAAFVEATRDWSRRDELGLRVFPRDLLLAVYGSPEGVALDRYASVAVARDALAAVGWRKFYEAA